MFLKTLFLAKSVLSEALPLIQEALLKGLVKFINFLGEEL
jgi:hypothetical protein